MTSRLVGIFVCKVIAEFILLIIKYFLERMYANMGILTDKFSKKQFGEIGEYRPSFYQLDAMVVDGPLSFHNPLENADYSEKKTAGRIVLKGTQGEFWPVGPEKLVGPEAKYRLEDGKTAISDLSELKSGHTLDDENFTRISTPLDPAERAKSVTYAMEFSEDNSDMHFCIETDWGDKLYPQQGDRICYGTPEFPADLVGCWTVNSKVFEATYEFNTPIEKTLADAVLDGTDTVDITTPDADEKDICE
jgi:hypothetical protein